MRCRDEICAQKVSQHIRVYAVILDSGRGDCSNLQRMSKQNFLAHVIELVVHRPQL